MESNKISLCRNSNLTLKAMFTLFESMLHCFGTVQLGDFDIFESNSGKLLLELISDAYI